MVENIVQLIQVISEVQIVLVQISVHDIMELEHVVRHQRNVRHDIIVQQEQQHVQNVQHE